MKLSISKTFYILWISVLPLFVYGQEEEPPTSEKGLAGINAHVNNFEAFLKDQEKELYHDLFIQESQLELYLKLLFADSPAQRKCQVSVDKTVSFNIMSSEEISSILNEESWKKVPELRRPSTQSTWQSLHGQYIIRFYDNSGIWVASKEGLDDLEKVHFEKSHPSQVSFWVSLDPSTLSSFLKDEQTKHYPEPGIRTFGQHIYLVKGSHFLLTEGGKNGKLFENKLILLRYLSEESTYETEAIKLLVNQLLKGTLREELFSFLFYLNPVQLKEVLQVYGAEPVAPIDLAEKQVEGYQFAEGPVLYNYPGYGFCRIFPNEKALEAYKAETTREINDPEFSIQSGLASPEQISLRPSLLTLLYWQRN